MAKRKRAAKPEAHDETPAAGVDADDAGNPSHAKPAKTEDKKKKQPHWREGLDFIVMLGGAVVIAILIKAFVFDVYLIPSGSMETALHGRPDGGDRIFCSKLNYHFRDLRRWEVAVFEFPYESARRTDFYNISEQYKDQNFVKRVIGLPNESLVIARGDIWTRPEGGGTAEYSRQVKPDRVQRGMWLNVYEEDFSDVSADELGLFWRKSGQGSMSLPRGGPLLLAPGSGSVGLRYRPMVPAGAQRNRMVELPGIPDRYTLEQPVQFRCRESKADGPPCGHTFVKSLKTQNMQARCPACGALADETSAVFYHRRSGLTAVGQYAVNPAYAPQGEDTSPRQADYHLVPDLRVVADAVFADEKSVFTISLFEDDRKVEALLTGDGRIEIVVNGAQSRSQDRAVFDAKIDKPHSIEFYVVDGTARIFVDSVSAPLLDTAVWTDRRPLPRSLPKTSGVGMAASGGNITVSRLAIDRDVFYYSGWETDRGEKFPRMNSQGEVTINNQSFFPMGDHCPSSFDARSWGPVPLSMLRGPAMFIWWPPERVGVIPSPAG